MVLHPTDADIQSALQSIPVLQTPTVRFYTEPMQYNALGISTGLFRMDGQLNAWVGDRILRPRVSAAYRASMSRKGTSGSSRSSLAQPTRTVASRPNAPFTHCIIYVRISTAVQEDSGATCERQFLELLDRINDFEDSIMQIKKIIVAIEYCSSSQHPWTCRKLPQSLLNTKDRLLLLSVNPDRVTRISQEVPTIAQSLAETGSEWWTLGVTDRVETWVCASSPTESKTIQEQLDLTRAVAVQHGLYSRAINFMTRILNSVQVQGTSVIAPELVQLQTSMASICSQYNHVIVFARTSPKFTTTGSSASEDMAGNPSTKRQREFLRQVLGLVQNDKISFHELANRSAFGDDTIQEMVDIFANLEGRVLVVTTMVDRLVRHEKHLPTLFSLLIQHGGQIASVLWDPLNFDIQASSSMAKAWQTLYPPQPAHALSPPVLVPEIWFDHATGAWNKNVLAHVKTAQNFCEGLRKTMRQGDTKRTIPNELVTAGIARGVQS